MSERWAGTGHSSGTKFTSAGSWGSHWERTLVASSGYFRGATVICEGGASGEQVMIARQAQMVAGRGNRLRDCVKKTGREHARINMQGGRKQYKWMEIIKHLEEQGI